jgi:hypothetical protein
MLGELLDRIVCIVKMEVSDVPSEQVIASVSLRDQPRDVRESNTDPMTTVTSYTTALKHFGETLLAGMLMRELLF